MSNIFLQNELSNIFDSITESNVSLPQWINIVEKANKYDDNTSTASVHGGGNFSATSQTNPAQHDGNFSATSQTNPGQHGGNFSATSLNSSTTKDVNKLISMLTSDSSSNINALSQTSTQSLEEQLRNILNQDGGAKNKSKSKKQTGGDNCDCKVTVDNVKQFFTTLKNNEGNDVEVKIDNKSMSEFFNNTNLALAQNTTTDMPNSEVFSDTSSSNIQQGGAEKKESKKSSKKGSKKSKNGVVNPGFKAFLDLKKYVAEKLKIKNGPQAAKVAGAVQKDMKEKYPDKDAVNIAKEGMIYFDSNMDHYKQLLPK